MYRIIIQHATRQLVPKTNLLRKWAKKTLSGKMPAAEMTLRMVGVEEMSVLNATYRHKKGPTNVLSFPFEAPPVGLKIPILGDVVICAEVVDREARAQKKSWEAHWAHMVVHGIFHLLGYDHETSKDAHVMEALEIKTMRDLGFPNPYVTGEDIKHYE